MSWFSKTQRVVVSDLEALVDKHRAAEEEFTQDYATGLNIIHRVRQDASEYAQNLRAQSQAIAVAAESISRKFAEPFEGDTHA